MTRTINSALSLAVDLSSANSLSANTEPKVCFQGQTHGHEGFLVQRDDAELIISSGPKYKKVLFPFLIAKEMIGNAGSLPNRYVIDMRNNDAFSARGYPKVFQQLRDIVYPAMMEKAETEKDNTCRETGPRQSHFKKWWKFWRTRDDLMSLIETLPRYCACGRVTKRPIFEFVSPKIHPNDALQIFSLEDDYSFGILQSNVHWEWFTAKCSTLKGDFRYTPNTVFDSFPWPQTATKKQIKKVADCAVELGSVRRQIMAENNYSFRDLYRIMEESPVNPVSEMQEELDDAVFAAYGLKKKDDILAFLLELNLKLSQKETSGEQVVGPGLPPIITNKSQFISNDCIQMP